MSSGACAAGQGSSNAKGSKIFPCILLGFIVSVLVLVFLSSN